MPQHLGGDLHQEGVEITFVPFGEDVTDLRRAQPGAAAQQVVGLGDQLHVGVLDAVVHHLDEVTGAVGADVRAAGRAIDVRGDLLQDRAERLVRLRGPAGHDRRAVQRTLLAARHAAPDEVNALVLQCRLPPTGVGELGVAAVDDDVAGFDQFGQFVDDGIRRATGLDHDQDLAGCRQRVDEVLGGLGRDEGSVTAVLLDQRAGLRGGPVVHGCDEAVAGEVPREVGTHDSQPGDTDIGLRSLLRGGTGGGRGIAHAQASEGKDGVEASALRTGRAIAPSGVSRPARWVSRPAPPSPPPRSWRRPRGRRQRPGPA